MHHTIIIGRSFLAFWIAISKERK